MKQSKGFTLLEVLVALAVLAIAMTAIIQAAAHSIASTHYLREQTFAGWVASNVVNSFLLDPALWTAEKLRKGDVEMTNRAWHWEARLSKTDDPGLRRLEVTVHAIKDSTISSTLTAFKRIPIPLKKPPVSK